MSARTATTRAAWVTGKVSAEQAVLIGAAVDKLSATVADEVVEHAQADLVDHAQTLTFTQLQVVANHLVEVVDPDGADAVLAEQLEAEEAQALQQTTFRGPERVRRGGPVLRADAEPCLRHAHHRVGRDRLLPTRNQPHSRCGRVGCRCTPQPGHDWCTVPGDGPGPVDVLPAVGAGVRELLEHLPADKLPGHGAGNATVVVTVDHHKLTTGVGEATLTTGTPVSVGEVRRLACNAGVLPAVLGADSAILDLGRSRRLFDRYQRIALAIRDRGCIFPG